MKEQLTAVFQQVSEGYIGFVEGLPGANAQGASLEEAPVPRHPRDQEFLAQKICRDLEIPKT